MGPTSPMFEAAIYSSLASVAPGPSDGKENVLSTWLGHKLWILRTGGYLLGTITDALVTLFAESNSKC